MTTSCPSILPSSTTFFLTVVGGWSQLPLGKRQLITALQLASVSRRQIQQRVCTSAIWIQSDAINIFPLRSLQQFMDMSSSTLCICLRMQAHLYSVCWLISWNWRFVRSNDIPDICDFFYLVPYSFVWNRSAFCLECRPQPSTALSRSNRAECSEFLAIISSK